MEFVIFLVLLSIFFLLWFTYMVFWVSPKSMGQHLPVIMKAYHDEMTPKLLGHQKVEFKELGTLGGIRFSDSGNNPTPINLGNPYIKETFILKPKTKKKTKKGK